MKTWQQLFADTSHLLGETEAALSDLWDEVQATTEDDMRFCDLQNHMDLLRDDARILARHLHNGTMPPAEVLSKYLQTDPED